MKHWLTGVGLLLLGAVIGAWVKTYVPRIQTRVLRDSKLVPVVVAVKALSAGTKLQQADLAQRMIPEQFVTRSVIRPSDLSRVLEHPLVAGMEAGDPLLWSLVASPQPRAPVDAR